MLRNGGLQLLQRGLLGCLGTCWVGEVEDVLGEGEVRVFGVLWIGTHDCWREGGGGGMDEVRRGECKEDLYRVCCVCVSIYLEVEVSDVCCLFAV